MNNIKGIGLAAVNTIATEYPMYRDDIIYIINEIPYTDTKGLKKGLQIRFTGCRNLQLCEQLHNLGHDADGNASVTKNTDILIVPMAGFSSSKTSKVGPNCKIVPIGDFIENMDKYLTM